MSRHFLHVNLKGGCLLKAVTGDFHKPHATIPIGFADDGASFPAVELCVYFNCVTDCEHKYISLLDILYYTPRTIESKYLSCQENVKTRARRQKRPRTGSA